MTCCFAFFPFLSSSSFQFLFFKFVFDSPFFTFLCSLFFFPFSATTQEMPWILPSSLPSSSHLTSLPLEASSSQGKFLPDHSRNSLHRQIFSLPHAIAKKEMNVTLSLPDSRASLNLRFPATEGSGTGSGKWSGVVEVKSGMNALDLEVLESETGSVSLIRLLYQGGLSQREERKKMNFFFPSSLSISHIPPVKFQKIKINFKISKFKIFLFSSHTAMALSSHVTSLPAQSLLLRLNTAHCTLSPSFSQHHFLYSLQMNIQKIDCLLIPVSGAFYTRFSFSIIIFSFLFFCFPPFPFSFV